jgi:hypothetical protein
VLGTTLHKQTEITQIRHVVLYICIADYPLAIFKGLVENNLMYSFENATNYQNTASNALNGLHDDGAIGGTGDSWKQQSFLSGFTIAISARAQILTLALINLCIILIVAINKVLISLYFC